MQLMLLRCADCPEIKNWLESKNYLSHEILSEIETLMARKVLKDILHDIREAEVFALIVDEASD